MSMSISQANPTILDGVIRLREDLHEARRYVRTRPTYATETVHKFMNKLQDLRGRNRTITDEAFRWTRNLTEGLRCSRAAPGVLEGDIDGASWELFVIQATIEKEMKPSDPDEPKP